MRWTKSPKLPPTVGEKRIVNRFLFIPIRIGNQVRWLEGAVLREECYLGHCSLPEGPMWRCKKWRPIAFID
jgi:hypothetical protein